jgi:capsular polysaccharide biosynthesis protein
MKFHSGGGRHLVTADRDEEPTDIGLVEAVWRYRWSSLLIILMCGLLSALATVFVLTGVTATARFAVTDPRSTSFLRQGVSSDSSYIAYTAQRATFAESWPVLERARVLLAEQEHYSIGVEALRAAVETSPASSGGIVEVTAKARTDRNAARIANAVIAAYRDLTRRDAERAQEQLLQSIRSTRAQVEDDLSRARGKVADSFAEVLVQLQIKESEARIDLTQYGEGVRFVDRANPDRVTPSALPKNVVIGLAVGTLLAIVIAFLRATTHPIATARRVTTGTGRRKRDGSGGPSEEEAAGSEDELLDAYDEEMQKIIADSRRGKG